MAGFDLTPQYEEALKSKYAQYVPQPVYDWRDALFGWATGSPQKKQNEWAQTIKNLELQDQTVAREKEQYEKAGLNPYAMLGSGGSAMFSGSGAQGYDDSESNSGGSVFKKLFLESFGALLTAVTKNPAPALILTSGSKVFDHVNAKIPNGVKRVFTPSQQREQAILKTNWVDGDIDWDALKKAFH